ncbi:hypothetical protein LLG46_08015 [bacterium]|nr:hypothetical protein [bacterium]
MKNDPKEPEEEEKPTLSSLITYGSIMIAIAIMTAPIILVLDSGHH